MNKYGDREYCDNLKSSNLTTNLIEININAGQKWKIKV